MGADQQGEHVDPAEGRPESFEHAYSSLFLPAMRLAYRLTGDVAEAEDIAAEAMARAYAHWNRISTSDYREAWVMKVAANVALDALRRRRPAFEAARRLRLSRPPEEAGGFDDRTALRLALVAALRGLPARQREVIVLHYFSGLTDEEISAALGIASSSVRTHLQRGLAALRKQVPFDFEGSGLAAL
jgi:RNA polymerase sigma-70 factor (ECF subfamily)